MNTEPFSVSGERVDLRPVSLDDAETVTAACQAPEISQNTTVPWPYTLDHATTWIAGSPQRWADGSADWTVRNHATGEFIGAISILLNSRFPEMAEIGYWTAKEHWGKGYTTEAVRLAVNAAFDRLGVTRITWLARLGNWGSWKPVWRCGFRREGVQRRPGGDMWQASLLKGDPMEPTAPWDGGGAGHGPALDPSQPGRLVAQFHSTYSMPNRLAEGGTPTLDLERLGMRISLIAEEYAELIGAVHGPAARTIVEEANEEAVAADDGTRNVVEAADALADLIYVIYGMALECGMDLDAVLAEVQASNLSKLMPDGSVLLREDGKVLKGPDFFPPNVRRALGLGES